MEKACSKCKTTKSFSEFHKHKGKPFGLTLWCKSCVKVNSANNYKTRPAEDRLKVKRIWQDANRDHVNSYNDNWRRANPDKHAARQAERRASKLKATPNWLSDEQKAHIKRLYALSKTMSEITGIAYHVDHIIPLNHKEVCGLHVPWNLQVLRADLNIKKSNLLEGELS